MSENTGSSRKRKAISATLTVAMAVTMLLSGTLAYYYSANATNVISNTMKEVVGHDDLFKVNDTEYNKDVYAENTGTKRVFVRIRLSESFSLDGSELVPASAGVIHTVEKASGEGETGYVAKHIVKNGGTNAYVPYTGAGATALDDYFSWELGGTGKYFLSKNSKEYPTSTNSPYYISASVAHDDRNKTFTAADAAADPKRVVKAPDCQIMTMAEYTALDQSGTGGTDERLAYEGWVIDTDGWAYWSQPVQPDKSTGLLLNKVILKKPKDLGNADYEYKIKVDYQAVDDDDMGIWLGEKDTDAEGNSRNNVEHATTEAQAMLRHLQTNSGTEEYDAKSVQLTNEINAAIDALPAGHDATVRLYNYALSYLTSTQLSRSEGREAYYNRAVWAKTAAEKLEQDIEGDQTLLTAECSELSQIKDAAIRNAIVKTYGKDGKLTKAQARAVVTIDATSVETLEGLSETIFPNLRRLSLRKPKMTTIDLGNSFPNLREFVVLETGATEMQVEKISLGSAAASIEDFAFAVPKLKTFNSTEENVINITATEKWRYFNYEGPEPTQSVNVSSAENLELIEIYIKKYGTWERNYDSTYFNTGLTLTNPKLKQVALYAGFTSAATNPVIDLSACHALQSLAIQQKSDVAVTCKVSDQAPLEKKNNSAGVTVETVPSTNE